MKAYVLAAIAGAVVVIAFWPGTLDVDGLMQIEQARTHHYGDWFPPLMAAVWSVLGTGGMLDLQNALFWGGIAVLARGRVWPVVAVFAFPPTTVWLGTLCKDSLMVAALTLATALVARRRTLFLVAAIFAASVKHRAELAALPFVFMWRRRLVLALLLLAGPRLITWALTDEREFPTQQVFIHDIAALTDPHPPGFQPLTLDPLLWGPQRLARAHTQEAYHALFATWRETVRAQPVAYLAHRWQIARAALGLHKMPWLYAFRGTPSAPEMASAYQGALVRWTFRPWIWLCLDAVLLVALWRRPLPRLLLIGALIYAVSFFPSLPSPQFRYLLWPSLAWLLALICGTVRGHD